MFPYFINKLYFRLRRFYGKGVQAFRQDNSKESDALMSTFAESSVKILNKDISLQKEIQKSVQQNYNGDGEM